MDEVHKLPGTSWSREPIAALPHRSEALLAGAIDLHVHGEPDVDPSLRNRGDDVATARLACRYGMSGWVLKSHLWPTMDRARIVQGRLVGLDFSVWGSITLNPVLGGVQPAVIELAAAHGARVVFLATWGAAADVARGGYIARLLDRVSPSFQEYSARHAISMLDGNGALSGAVRDAIDACHALGLSLATGHASLDESRAVATYCAEIGQPLLINHPLHYVDSAVDLLGFVELGALIEFSGAPLLHPEAHLTIREVHEALSVVGADQAVLTTDAFSRWVPPEPECLRMFLEQLAFLGWSEHQLRQMVTQNPRRFLGIANDAGSSVVQEAGP